MSKMVSKQVVAGSKVEHWWMRGREEASAIRLDAILVDQIEWLPERVLSQLIAPAKNDDADNNYMEFDFS